MMKEPRHPLFAARGFVCQLVAMAVAAGAGCITQPYEGARVTKNSPIHIEGYAQTWDLVTLELYNTCVGLWEDNAVTLSSFDPSFPAGYWTNSPELHFYEFDTLFPSACHFDSTSPICTTGGDCVYFRVRVDSFDHGSSYLYRGNADTSLGCTLGQLGIGADFYTAAYNCGYNNTVLILRSN